MWKITIGEILGGSILITGVNQAIILEAEVYMCVKMFIEYVSNFSIMDVTFAFKTWNVNSQNPFITNIVIFICLYFWEKYQSILYTCMWQRKDAGFWETTILLGFLWIKMHKQESIIRRRHGSSKNKWYLFKFLFAHFWRRTL